MMRWIRLGGWSITARLVTLALVPASLMLIVVNVSLYTLSMKEARADIRERGRIVAAALVEGSRYGVISGNVDSVERMVRGLMAADPSIASIRVLDSADKVLVSVAPAHGGADLQVFEAPITAGALEVNLFDTPPPSAGAAGRTARAELPVGLVRVVMSPEPILEARRERLYFGSATVLLAALVSAAVGLVLAKRLREPLNAVMAALRGIRQGRFKVQLDGAAAGELGELQSTIVDMATGLELTQQQLEGQVASRTQQLRAAIETVRAADAEKRRLIARGNQLVEDERRRISLEIHDDLNAVLVSVRLQAAALAAAATERSQPELREAAEGIAAVIDELYLRARSIVRQLRPEILDTLGLEGAIEEMVRHYDEIHPECRFDLVSAGRLPVVPEQVAIAAYRVVQEALSNVVKHAKASNCTVTLEPLAGRAGIRVAVRDDGQGFEVADAGRGGLGIVGMRERASALGGSLEIESAAGQGTTVTMTVPLPAS